MNILYLASFATKDIITKYPNSGIDIYKVSEFLVKGFSENRNVNLKVITSPDLPKYPKIKELYIKHRVIDEVELVSSMNVSVIRQVWTIFSMLIACSRVISKNIDKTYIIIPYMMFRHVITVRLLKIFFRNKTHICTIVPDIFFYEKKQVLNYYSNRFTEYLTKKSDSFVLYTETMAAYLKIEKRPYIVMEGCIDPSLNIFSKCHNSGSKKTIVYTGSLFKKYGICRMVDSMQHITDDVEMLLYGKGDAVEYIVQASQRDNRIKYMGVVSKEEVIKVQNSSTILVNPRNDDDGEFTKYSCPSKILEYLLTGKPSVICKLAGVPKDYYKYFIVSEDTTTLSLSKAIIKALSLTEEEKKKCIKGRDFVIERTNYKHCCERIIELIKNKE